MEQNQDNKDFAGKGGFIWWTGVVEDRQDPLKLGRCRVRIVGWHADDKAKLETEMLPWATPIFPLNNTNTYAPREDDMVFGFFMDGESAQAPVIFGYYPGIPLQSNAGKPFADPATDLATRPKKPYEEAIAYPRKPDEPTTSRLARNDAEYISEINTSKAAKKLDKVEQDSYYAATYPYNNVYESESGHVLEFDDTRDKERVHLYHRSGSYVEWGPEGDRNERIERNKFTVVVGDEQIYVKGDVTIYVDGNVTAKILGNVDADIGGNTTAKVGGNMSMDIGGTCSITSGGTMTFVAPKIDLNP